MKRVLDYLYLSSDKVIVESSTLNHVTNDKTDFVVDVTNDVKKGAKL